MADQHTQTSDSHAEPFPGYDELTVAQITDRLAAEGDATVEKVKAYEAANQDRKGVLGWQRPQEQGEPTFTRERVLGDDGPEIVGHPHHVIVGALHDDDTTGFTRAELARKVADFLDRPATVEER